MKHTNSKTRPHPNPPPLCGGRGPERAPTLTVARCAEGGDRNGALRNFLVIGTRLATSAPAYRHRFDRFAKATPFGRGV
jgi:hypothetical protein